MVRKKSQCQNVDWLTYFENIKSVCPWSLPAYKKGQIDIQAWRGVRVVLDGFLARIYICNLTPTALKRLAKEFNQRDLNNEWFWSHPRYKNHSTPVPCLIQQDKKYIAKIRQKINEKNLDY